MDFYAWAIFRAILPIDFKGRFGSIFMIKFRLTDEREFFSKRLLPTSSTTAEIFLSFKVLNVLDHVEIKMFYGYYVDLSKA